MFSVFIEPHERTEAIAAWKDRLTPEQVDEIDEVPETALIRLYWIPGAKQMTIQIIEEG